MQADEPAEKRTLRLLIALLTAGLAVLLSLGVLGLPQDTGLSGTVQGSLSESGVDSPVTAVLLNFRGYDTLLEISVLLLALLGVLALTGGSDNESVRIQDPVLSGLTRLIVPLMILVSGYLLYEGSFAPGGAFQAGAVLGSAAVLSRLAGLAPSERYSRAFLIAAMLGFVLFLFIALIPMAAGGTFLEYPPGPAYILIFAIEAGLTISIAIILYFLFCGGSAIPSRDTAGGRLK